MAEPIKIDVVVKSYMTFRQQKEEIEREAKNKVDAIKQKMAKLEAFLLLRMQEEGVNSFKTPYGTAFSTTTDYANVVDWEETIEYIKTNEAYDLLEKRVNKTAVRNMIDGGSQPPPGVNYGQRKDVNIRKPTTTE